MLDRRDIDVTLQRTRPDPVGPDYGRTPAGGRAAPVGGPDAFWAVVVDGTAHGKARRYYTAGAYGEAWYIDEAWPSMPHLFPPPYPSHTRDAADNWIETIVWNAPDGRPGSNWFWPIGVGAIIRVRRIDFSGSPYWIADVQALPCPAIVTAVDAGGFVSAAEWTAGPGGASLSLAVPSLFGPYSPGAGVAYPFAAVDDPILLAPAINNNHWFDWYDLTPRIALHNQAKTSAPTERAVHVDVSAGGPGVPWILDTDT